MQNQIFVKPKKERSAQVRASLKAATGVMEREGSLFSLTMSLLLVLLSGLCVYFFTAILGYTLEELTVLSYEMITVLYLGGIVLVCITLLFPLMLGRLRMAGMLAMGESVLAKECFYYFTSPRRYLRGLWLGTVYGLTLLLPIALLAAVAVGPYLLYEGILSYYLIPGVAVLLLVLSYPIGIALTLLLLFLLGRFACAVPLAVGNPDMGLLCALRCSRRITKGKRKAIFAFFFHCVWRMLLSLFTLCVLWILYYAHATDVAYFDLTLAFWQENKPE